MSRHRHVLVRHVRGSYPVRVFARFLRRKPRARRRGARLPLLPGAQTFETEEEADQQVFEECIIARGFWCRYWPAVSLICLPFF